MPSILDTVRSAYGAGLCLLPVAENGSKAPDVPTWTPYKTVRPTAGDMRAFGFAQRAGFGVITGAVSGHRECWDFDCPEIYQAFVEQAAACGLGAVVDRIIAGYCDATPGRGRRWLVEYPVSVDWRDCTLARRPGREGEPKVKTLIELPTFAIVAPSNGATHPSGKPYVRLSGRFDTIASYSAEERDALIELARTFDQMPRRELTARRITEALHKGDRPGDDYNGRMTWTQLLEPAGWIPVFDRSDVTYWRRPGKAHGVSATTNFGGSDLFFPFTSSTEFEPETSYSKFAVYALLEHRGDFKRAALALVEQGFGHSEDDPPAAVVAPAVPAIPHTLTDTIAVFRRWLYLEDPCPVYVVAATLVANRAPGDPVWLLLVCAPSMGKTEILSAATRLSWVTPAAKVTEASLLSARRSVNGPQGLPGGY